MRQLQLVRKDVIFQKDFLRLMENMRNTALLSYTKTRDIEGGYYEERLSEIKNLAAMLYRANVKSSFVSTLVERSCLILVTPDSGMMGGLNNHVMDQYRDLVSHCSVEPLTIVLGEKGASELEEKKNIVAFSGYRETPEDISSKVEQIREQVFSEVLNGTIGKVGVVYPAALSFTKQVVKYDILLPCAELLGNTNLKFETSREIILESSPGDMAAHLASQWLSTRLYMVFKDAKLAEFSARAIHLSSSQQSLERRFEELKTELSHVRKELIDKQSREAAASQLLRERKKKRELRSKHLRDSEYKPFFTSNYSSVAA